MRKYILLLYLSGLPALMMGQAEQRDTTNTMQVGYFSGSQNTLAGAVDKVTEERMNKGFVTSSLDALSGQSAGDTEANSRVVWNKTPSDH